MANRRFRDPAIPHPTDDNVVNVLSALKESVEIGQRLRGDEGDSFVRRSEFITFTNSPSTQAASTHVSDTNNPHEVTAEQVGADPVGSSLAVQTNLDNHASDGTIHNQVGVNIGDIAEWNGSEWVASTALSSLEEWVEDIATAVGFDYVTHNGEEVTINGQRVYHIRT